MGFSTRNGEGFLPSSANNSPTTECKLCHRVVIFHEWDMALHLLQLCPHAHAHAVGLAAVVERANEHMAKADKVKDCRTSMERRSAALRCVLASLPASHHAEVCHAVGMPSMTPYNGQGHSKMKEAIRKYDRSRNYMGG